MTKEEIHEKIDAIIIEQLGVYSDDIQPDAILGRELGADGIDAVELTVKLEETFGIHVPDAQMNSLDTYSVKEVYELVEKLIDK